MSASALEGIRVVDFGQYMAGPMAAMFLADFGAEVIRIERPGGPVFDVPGNATWNRGKRSLALDLNQTPDRAVARELVARADVLIENFRPGVMARWGLDWESLRHPHPRLVYCAIKGFAKADPRYRLRATEGIVAAAAGIYSPTPISGLQRPVYTALPIASMYGAHWAAICTAMALHARRRGGAGQYLEIPLFGAALTAFSGKLMRVHNQPEAEPRVKARYARCRDGRWFMYFPKIVTAALLEETGMGRWFGNEALGATGREQAEREFFAGRTAGEWEACFARHGIEAITCNEPRDWARHPLARQTGIIGEYDDPLLGRFAGPGVNPRLSETPGRVRASRPLPDQHGAAIRAELAAPATPATPAAVPPAAAALRSALQGIRVLDLGIVLASPSCGRTLAEFGADVIKIDSPLRNPISWHNDINRGKRSILLDLKQPAGLEIFWRLAERADVILENFRSGVADKMGIGYEAVRARNPGIVYCSVNAYGQGTDHDGRPGREPLAQAISGMQMRYGGDSPAVNSYNANDYATGLATCYGVALALYHRARSGRGQRVQGALVYSATTLQSALLQDFAGKRWDEPRGQAVLGTAPWNRAYQAADGWVFVSGTRGALAGFLGGEARDDAGLQAAMQAALAGDSVAEVLDRLQAAGIAAHRVVIRLAEIMRDPAVLAQGLALTREHEGSGLVTTLGTVVHCSGTPPAPGAPASRPGADAQGILAEIGMAGRLAELVQNRVIVTEGIEPGGSSF